MAKGPRSRVSFRRRIEGKTDYHKRLKLLKSRKLRAVIRASNNHIRVQIIKSALSGDKILVSAYSQELTSKYKWNASTGNIPAAYLTGYLAGIKAKKNDIQEVIFDLGIFYHRNRVLAACKGIIDTGISIPYREEFFPENFDNRTKGLHIEEYAKLLKTNEPEKYEQIFSGYLKNQKIDPVKISQQFTDSLKMIEKNI